MSGIKALSERIEHAGKYAIIRFLNPSLPAALADSFVSDEDDIEDEHHVIFACSTQVTGMHMPGSLCKICSGSLVQLLATP